MWRVELWATHPSKTTIEAQTTVAERTNPCVDAFRHSSILSNIAALLGEGHEEKIRKNKIFFLRQSRVAQAGPELTM